ncbi:MAG: IS21 family transposase [Mycoplasmataceae bacterium]|jgi:hypothetical protein|nr:IS21 family transposase [Mycoplasmataceae bacterium]
MKVKGLDDEIRRCLMENTKVNLTALGKKFSLDRHTVKRHINKVEASQTKVRKRRSCFLKSIDDTIKNEIEKPEVTIKALYLKLINIYKFEQLGTYSNFSKYVHVHFDEIRKAAKNGEVKLRYETEPGEQLQFDWIESIKSILKNGEEVTYNIWSATLGYSRYHVFIPTPTITEEDFKRCLMDTLILIGGKPRTVLTDNMSAIVNVNKGKKKVHPTVIQFMKDMDIKLQLCKVRHPYTKGKVEVSNKYQDWLKPYDRMYDDVDSLYSAVRTILNQSNFQVNSSTKFAPMYLFKKEKAHLLELPNNKVMLSYRKNLCTAQVNNSSLISYQGVSYGVPQIYCSKKVLVQENNQNIYIYSMNQELLQIYEKQKYGIHYAKDFYEGVIRNITKESREVYEERIEKNLKQLAKLGSIEKEGEK